MRFRCLKSYQSKLRQNNVNISFPLRVSFFCKYILHLVVFKYFLQKISEHIIKYLISLHKTWRVTSGSPQEF